MQLKLQILLKKRLMANRKQWVPVGELIDNNLITTDMLLAKPSSGPNQGVNALWIMADRQQWDLIGKLINNNLITTDMLLAALSSGHNKGINVLWIMARREQWDLIGKLINNNLITTDMLLAKPSSGESQDISALTFMIQKKQWALIDQLIEQDPKIDKLAAIIAENKGIKYFTKANIESLISAEGLPGETFEQLLGNKNWEIIQKLEHNITRDLWLSCRLCWKQEDVKKLIKLPNGPWSFGSPQKEDILFQVLKTKIPQDAHKILSTIGMIKEPLMVLPEKVISHIYDFFLPNGLSSIVGLWRKPKHHAGYHKYIKHIASNLADNTLPIDKQISKAKEIQDVIDVYLQNKKPMINLEFKMLIDLSSSPERKKVFQEQNKSSTLAKKIESLFETYDSSQQEGKKYKR